MKTLRLSKKTLRQPMCRHSVFHEKLSFITRDMIRQVFLDENLRLHTVCFTGHRRVTESEAIEISHRMDEVLEACYHQGYREFLVGAALGFDMLAGEAVQRLQIIHPDVRLIVVIPCVNQSQRWSKHDCNRYERLVYAADETRVLAENYYEGCMMVRNRHMVDHSSLCLCYLKRFKGGTVSTVSYAVQQNVNVINLAMEDACTAFIRESTGD